MNGTVSDCRYCPGLVFLDREGRPVHTSLEYECRDRWGLLISRYADPVEVIARAIGRAQVEYPGAHRAEE